MLAVHSRRLLRRPLRCFLVLIRMRELFLSYVMQFFMSHTPDWDFRCFYTCEIKDLPLLVFNGGSAIPTRGPTVRVGNEASKFPTERWT